MLETVEPPWSGTPLKKGKRQMTAHPNTEVDAGVEQVLDDIIDLEEYAKLGKRPPLAKGYRIRVNGDPFVVHEPTPNGRAILTLAGLLPAEDYTLRVKLAGEKPRKVELNEKVDLRHPGVEKFKALPRDQTEG
jgi:hypothetical protein